MSGKYTNVKKISLAAILITLGVVVSPFTWFPVPPTRANPTQHMLNALSGVLLGPLWAAFIALCVGLIRMSLGTGTIFSLPGGIPGGIVVGLSYLFLRRLMGRHPELAALTEPIGTILIGVPLAVYLFAPLVGTTMVIDVVSIVWIFICIPGSVLGFIILKALRATGLTRESFSGTRLLASSN